VIVSINQNNSVVLSQAPTLTGAAVSLSALQQYKVGSTPGAGTYEPSSTNSNRNVNIGSKVSLISSGGEELVTGTGSTLKDWGTTEGAPLYFQRTISIFGSGLVVAQMAAM